MLDLKKYLNISNIFIIICVFCILIFFTVIMVNINYIVVNSDFSNNLDISSVLSSLIVALISLMGIVINTKYVRESISQTNKTIEENKRYNELTLNQTYKMMEDNRLFNQKSLNQTETLIKQNEESRFVQLRFHDAEMAIYYLMNELQKTFTIYDDIKYAQCDKLFLNPRGFLIVQYVNLISDIELLEHLPLKIKSNFQNHFLKRAAFAPNLESEMYIKELNSYFQLDYHIITKNNIITFYEFEEVIKKFNANCVSGYFKYVFGLYYSSDVTLEEFEQHLVKMIDELSNVFPEDHIIDEMNLEITPSNYLQLIKKD